MGGARPAVRLLLEIGDMSAVEPRPHRVLERVGLDDPDALHRLLHGFEDARAAGELPLGDAGDATDHLAQEVERGRHDHEAEERHHRVLHDHHDQQSDQHQQIAADGADDQVDGGTGGRGSGGRSARAVRSSAGAAKNSRFWCTSVSKIRRWLSAMIALPICESLTACR